MNINAIGVIKDGHNIRGYRLLDTDDNNKILDVTEGQIISVLKANKLKIHNMKLVKHGYKFILQGIRYSLDLLPQITSSNAQYEKLIVLEQIGNICTVARCDGEVVYMDYSSLMIYKKCIINMDKYNRFLCPIKNNSSKENDTKQIISDQELNELEKEARDINVVWTLSKFHKYMAAHDWYYVLKDFNYRILFRGNNHVSEDICEKYNNTYCCIEDIDPRCNILHLPSNILMSLNNTFDNENNEDISIDTLIINSNCKEFYNISGDPKFKLHIKNLYFQHGSKKGDFRGLNFVEVDNLINIPQCNELEYFMNQCSINCDLNIDSVGIVHSFNQVDLKGHKLQLKNCFDVNTSLCDIKNIDDLKIDGIRSSSSSFNNINIQCINTSNLSEMLIRIEYSFNNNVLLESIDLSECKKLYIVSGSFKECHNLSYVKLPDSLEQIRLSFINAKITEFKLPTNIKIINYDIFNDNTTIIYPENITLLHNKLFYNLKNTRKIKFLGKITYIEKVTDELLDCTDDIDTLLLGIETLTNGCFCCTEHSLFDSRKMPKIHTIKSGIFNGSFFKDLILWDTIENIESYVMENTHKLRNVALGPSIKNIDNNAFAKTNNITITYYCKANTYAEKFLKRKKLAYKLINSPDEMFNLTGLDKANKTKYKMILANSEEYNYLLDDSFVDNVDYLYRLIKKVEQAEKVEIPEELKVLNTSKFKYINKSKYNYKDSEFNVNYKLNENYFISLTNLFITIFDNCNYLYSERVIKDINEKDGITPINTIYKDKNRQIAVFICKIQNYTLKILVITIDNNIVFQCPLNTDKLYESKSFNSFHMFYKINTLNLENSSTARLIGNEIITGDSYNNIRLHGVKVPKKIENIFKSYIQLYWVYIGYKANHKFSDVAKQTTLENRNYDMLFYDLHREEFIELNSRCKFKVNNKASFVMDGFLSFKIVSMTKLEDIDNIDKKYFRETIEASKDKQLLNILKLASLTEEELNSTYDVNNYDLDGNKLLCRAADELYKCSLRNLDNINRNQLDALNKLLQTDMFRSEKISISNCEKKMYTNNLYNVEGVGGGVKVVTYKIDSKYSTNSNSESYATAIKTPKTPLSSGSVLKISDLPIETIVKTLYYIGKYRYNMNYSKSKNNGISNDKINIDDFECMRTITFSYGYARNMKVHLALDKLNCDAYLLLDILDQDFYSLFRFKHYTDAEKFLFNDLANRQVSLTDLANKLINHDLGVSGHNNYVDLRNEILNGKSNTYPYYGNDLDIFNQLAKQPKQ